MQNLGQVLHIHAAVNVLRQALTDSSIGKESVYVAYDVVAFLGSLCITINWNKREKRSEKKYKRGTRNVKGEFCPQFNLTIYYSLVSLSLSA